MNDSIMEIYKCLKITGLQCAFGKNKYVIVILS